MALETGTYIKDLVSSNPTGSDAKSQGDDHLRLIKSVLLNSIAGFQGVVLVGGTDTGAANAYVLPAAIPAYTTGMLVIWQATNANTGASTININSLGAKSIFRSDGTALSANDIVANQNIVMTYNGTEFRLLVQGNALIKGNNLSDVGNAATSRTNLGAAASGTNTDITSLNSPALGSATATTQSAADNTTKVSTTAFVTTALANLLAAANSWTNTNTFKGVTETVYTISDGASFEINPANGSIQTITLGANRTPKGTSFANGQSVTLQVTAGANSLIWTDTTFGGTGVKWIGGAPTLSATVTTTMVLWKIGGQVYGKGVGDA